MKVYLISLEKLLNQEKQICTSIRYDMNKRKIARKFVFMMSDLHE